MQAEQRVRDRLIEKFDVAYLVIDEDARVQSVSSNVQQFGFDEIPIGADITDHIDFMVGVDFQEEIDLPLISSPDGQPISVSLWPDKDSFLVIIRDATKLFLQRHQLQQKANENELLTQKQAKLMSELEKAQQDLVEKNRQLTEASRLQSSFLSGVSHEFRTPLTSILGYSDLLTTHLANSGESDNKPKNYLSAVRRSSKHLLSLVENLLDHGKLDSQELVINPKPTRLKEVLDDIELLLSPLSVTKAIKLDIACQFSADKTVMLDDSRLRQCLLNLIGNAIKFTDQGSVSVNCQLVEGSLLISVIDTGIGISPQDIEKIRSPFWQVADTGKAGTGLGLTITDRIIELMGGELHISSELGQGTKVCFEIPAPSISEQEQAITLATKPAQEDLQILLAEDDNDIADITVVLLEQSGVTVKRVENGALAVAQCIENEFDLVLMDLHMPILDGYQAIKQIRQQDKKVPILVMSATPIEAAGEQALDLQCDGYLVKPVDVADVLSIANTLVADRSR